MNLKRTLLVIDAQVDFHEGGNLAVPGATADTARLSVLIPKLNPSVIIASLDSHYVLDIAHPSWWADKSGVHPSPFTMITAADVENGVWTPRVDPTASLEYLRKLEANGEFPHLIWPEHCIIGTPGHALMPDFMDALNIWSKTHLAWPNFINKGANPFAEHFGIFRANVPNADPSTDVNHAVFRELNTADELYLAGQARSHCVANSLKQLLDIAPNLASKLFIIEDCMSDVPGLPPDFYVMVQGIYDDAKAKGVRFVKSTDF